MALAIDGPHSMISDCEFSRMKQGAILIDTARGNIVDVEAMVRALAASRRRALTCCRRSP
jgi:D-lactate dehydrogenase